MPEYSPGDPIALIGRTDAADLWREHGDVEVLALLESHASATLPADKRRVYLHAARNELQVLLARSETR